MARTGSGSAGPQGAENVRFVGFLQDVAVRQIARYRLTPGVELAQAVLLDLVVGDLVQPVQREQVAVDGVGAFVVKGRIAVDVARREGERPVGRQVQLRLDPRTVGCGECAGVGADVVERSFRGVHVRHGSGLFGLAPVAGAFFLCVAAACAEQEHRGEEKDSIHSCHYI